MVEISQPIELNLAEKLRDRDYRRKFFLAEASARIARQIISLRKMRGLTQADLAKEAGTKQPAISRCERADYQNWSFNTLRSIADALDARIRVIIEPAEVVLREYERPTATATNNVSNLADVERRPRGPTLAKLADAKRAESEDDAEGSSQTTIWQRPPRLASFALANSESPQFGALG